MPSTAPTGPTEAPSTAPSSAPTGLNTRPPNDNALKTTYDQSFLGDSLRCADYKDDILAANADANGFDKSKVTVTAGAGCTGSRRRMLSQDSLTFHIEIAQWVDIDVPKVEALVEQHLAESQPTLVLVSMTEPAYEAVVSEDKDSQSPADEDMVSSLTNSWVELAFLAVPVLLFMICMLLLCFCVKWCCCPSSSSSTKDPIPGPETVSPLFSDITTPALQTMWNTGSPRVQSRNPVETVQTDMGGEASPDSLEIETPTFYEDIILSLEVHPETVPSAASDEGHTSTTE